MKKTIIFAAVLVGLVFIVYLLSQRGNSDVPNSTASALPTVSSNPSGSPKVTVSPSSTASPTSSPTATTVSSVKTFTVIGRPFSFTPAQITVNKGDTVKIIFKDESGNHNLVIDAFNARTSVIQGGQEQMVQFLADKTGTFEYYCSVGTHRELGMKGTFIVK